MAKSNDEFWQQYRDPRWQRRRLEIMESAGFKCEECGTGSATLNVHHRHYIKDRAPWDYEDDELRCLCEDCHTDASEAIRELKVLAGRLSEFGLRELIGVAKSLLLTDAEKSGESMTFTSPAEIWGIMCHVFPGPESGELKDLLVKAIFPNGCDAPGTIPASEVAAVIRGVGDRAAAAGSKSGRRIR